MRVEMYQGCEGHALCCCLFTEMTQDMATRCLLWWRLKTWRCSQTSAKSRPRSSREASYAAGSIRHRMARMIGWEHQASHGTHL